MLSPDSESELPFPFPVFDPALVLLGGAVAVLVTVMVFPSASVVLSVKVVAEEPEDESLERMGDVVGDGEVDGVEPAGGRDGGTVLVSSNVLRDPVSAGDVVWPPLPPPAVGTVAVGLYPWKKLMVSPVFCGSDTRLDKVSESLNAMVALAGSVQLHKAPGWSVEGLPICEQMAHSWLAVQ